MDKLDANLWSVTGSITLLRYQSLSRVTIFSSPTEALQNHKCTILSAQIPCSTYFVYEGGNLIGLHSSRLLKELSNLLNYPKSLIIILSYILLAPVAVKVAVGDMNAT